MPTKTQEALKRYFGHESFRDGQERLIDALLAGRDALGVMPTGAGKSICYQLPGLMLPGLTLVISPLISLMKDQVMALIAAGVPAAYINSSLTPGQQQEAVRRAKEGRYKIIYVAPERLEMPAFVDFAKSADISLLAVDEAHCVSQWGQDFRPSYLRIPSFISQLPVRPPVGAFTATATKRVREDVVRLLELQAPLSLCTGYDRPNLHFTSVKPNDKFAMLCRFLDGEGDVCGIVYCSTRKNVEDVCQRLQEAGYSATRYHAGLSDRERKENQEDFRLDRVRVMVATNAFGMGIDKSDVRFVAHYNMPLNLESYYQEAGRAGRDGEQAECLLLYSGQDVITGRWMLEHSDGNPDLDADERAELLKRDLERLKQMTFYATSKSCLRRFILRYFGEANAPEACGACSVCDGSAFEVDTKRAAMKKSRPSGGAAFAFTPRETAIYENLRMLRSLLAARSRIPAYVVFSDATLHDMVKRNPANLDEFLLVSGVGQQKQARYGSMFLAVLRDGVEPNEAMEQEE